jgi:CspA family cold shock protein
MATGRVKWFNDSRGYGFISNDAGGQDLFVHYTGIQAAGHKSLAMDEPVEFDIVQGKKGPQAENVRPAA